LGKYIFQPAKQCSIFSIMSSQIDMALKKAPSRRQRCFKVKEETLKPRILVRPSALLTLPTRTNLDLDRLIFKPNTTSKQKNKPHK